MLQSQCTFDVEVVQRPHHPPRIDFHRSVVCRLPVCSKTAKRVMVVLACSDRTLALSHVNVDVDSSMLKASSSSSLHGEEALHAGVACEVCRVTPIEGVRYSCTVRKRYDNEDEDDDKDEDNEEDDEDEDDDDFPHAISPYPPLPSPIRFNVCSACESLSVQPYPMIKIPSRDDDINTDIDDDDHDDHGSNNKNITNNSKSMTHWAYMMFTGYKDHPTLSSMTSHEQSLLKHDHVMCDVCDVKPIVGTR